MLLSFKNKNKKKLLLFEHLQEKIYLFNKSNKKRKKEKKFLLILYFQYEKKNE
jgi:hypothetical protein